MTHEVQRDLFEGLQVAQGQLQLEVKVKPSSILSILNILTSSVNEQTLKEDVGSAKSEFTSPSIRITIEFPFAKPPGYAFLTIIDQSFEDSIEHETPLGKEQLNVLSPI